MRRWRCNRKPAGSGAHAEGIRLRGIVTRVVRGTVMAQVEIQAGRHRIVALMSRDAADQLALAPGPRVGASAMATDVLVHGSNRAPYAAAHQFG